jgi:hypothetical protein
VSHPNQWKDQTGREFLTSDSLLAALFTAALLSRRNDLDVRLRSQIISRVPSFDIHSSSQALDGLANAFQSAGFTYSPWELRASTMREAVATATKWLQSGIFMVARHELTAPGSGLHDLPPVFFAKGDRSLLGLTASAVLNSRKSRTVSPQDHWINITKELVSSAMEHGSAIASSYGNLPYSLVTCLAKGFPVILACDDVLPFMDSEPKAAQFLSAYGDLFRSRQTLFISSFPPGRVPARANRLAERDHVVAALSSVLMVGEVKPGGNMFKILEIASRRKIKIIEFHPDEVHAHKEHEAKGTIRGQRFGQSSPQQSGRATARSKGPRWPDFAELGSDRSYLIHYTRSCPGPWPGQTMAEYCRSLIDAAAGSGHTSFDTLQRILEEKLVRASHRLTRGSSAVVSLTECLPGELSTIVKWRRGLIRWNFEPYGIAVRKDALIRLGARQVIYGTEETLRELPEDQKWVFQVQETGGKEWVEEKEWRLPGDLLLTLIPREDLVVIVPDPEEARIVRTKFGYKIISAGIGECQCCLASEAESRYTAVDSERRTSHGV